MTPFPLHSGSSADCGRVVAALREANFREATICGALKLGDLSDLGTANSQNTDLRGLAPGLGFCIRLFLFFEPVARAALELALGREVVGSLVALGILEPADEKGWRLRAAVFFYPVTGWYVASDSVVGPDRGPVVPFDDWLLPAIFEETLRFVRLAPPKANSVRR